jgi:hypothetical protein
MIGRHRRRGDSSGVDGRVLLCWNILGRLITGLTVGSIEFTIPALLIFYRGGTP